MSTRPARRSLLALAGATAGIVSLAAAPPAAAAHAKPEPDAGQSTWLPPNSQPVTPAAQGTCTTFRDVLPDSSIDVWVPTTSSGSGDCILVQGNQGDGVRKLQLAIHDCYPSLRGVLGPVDGIYGSGTRDAVTFVQAIEGVTADGVYGFQTKNAMEWPGYVNLQLFDCRRLI